MRIPTAIASKLAPGLSALALATVVVGYYEGRSLIAYLDPIGIPTICEGWTQGVKLGDVATAKECDEKTLAALEEADRTLRRWVRKEIIDQMPLEMYAAILSFIYNVGPGKPGKKDGFVYLKNGKHSTMLRHIQAGNFEAACRQLPLWNKAAGEVLRGLTYRRQTELALCLQEL